VPPSVSPGVDEVRPAADEENRAMQSSGKLDVVKVGRALVYLVYFFVMLSLAILVMGFFLLLFGANPDAAFAEWVYRALDRA
jgi:hypothetical protein